MVNIFLLIELLKMTDATATVDRLKVLELDNCKFANVLQLNKEKIIAQLDCDNYDDASKAILRRGLARWRGSCKRNIIAAVRPVHRSKVGGATAQAQLFSLRAAPRPNTNAAPTTRKAPK